MTMRTLRAVTTEDDWHAMHEIRRAVLFAPGRHPAGVVYDDAHPDDRDPRNQCFLFWLDERPIGVVRLDERAPAVGAVRLVAVVVEFQRQGHGRELGRLIEAEARSRGMRRLVVNAHPDAIGFYERTGWHFEEWDCRELTGIAASCVQMAKLLEPSA
jgi:GNAT superfamily N-acetyltransferase